MKIKDALVGLILWIGILVFMFMVSAMESLPMWFVAILAVITWIAYILVAIREREREKRALNNPVMWAISTDANGVRYWSALDGSGRTRSFEDRPSSQPLFDQDGQEV